MAVFGRLTILWFPEEYILPNKLGALAGTFIVHFPLKDMADWSKSGGIEYTNPRAPISKFDTSQTIFWKLSKSLVLSALFEWYLGLPHTLGS